MEVMLSGLQYNVCLIYLDDVIIFGHNLADHLSRLEEVFIRLRAANLKLKPSKCTFLCLLSTSCCLLSTSFCVSSTSCCLLSTSLRSNSFSSFNEAIFPESTSRKRRRPTGKTERHTGLLPASILKESIAQS